MKCTWHSAIMSLLTRNNEILDNVLKHKLLKYNTLQNKKVSRIELCQIYDE